MHFWRRKITGIANAMDGGGVCIAMTSVYSLRGWGLLGLLVSFGVRLVRVWVRNKHLLIPNPSLHVESRSATSGLKAQ